MNIKLKKLLCSTCLITLFPITTFAKDIPVNSKFVMEFNDNIYIYDGEKTTPIKCIYQPEEFLINGKTYTIKLNKNIKSINDEDVSGKSQYEFTIDGDKNKIFTQEYLKNLVNSIEPTDEIVKFKNRKIDRQNNKEKVSFKYFNLFYNKNDKFGKVYADEIAKYADTAYIYLVQLYGKQVPVEIYLIDENHASQLKEGNIRKSEMSTFVYINDEHTEHKGDIIYELIHEMNHNFFSTINNAWDDKNDKYKQFIEESISRFISIPYTFEAFMDLPPKYVSNYKFDEYLDLKRSIQNNNYGISLSFNNFVDELSIKGLWGYQEKDWKKQFYLRNRAMTYWMYIYNSYDISKFETLLRTIGNSNYEKKFEEIYGLKFEDVEKNIYN